QCADEGALRRMTGDTASGSIVQSHGAKVATTIIRMRMAPPTIAIGWRRNASRNRRHVGDTDFAALVAGAERTVATLPVQYRMRGSKNAYDRSTARFTST